MNVEPDRPALSADEAARLLEARWGVMGTLAPLPSERDQNFRVDGDDGARFVLKIAGGTEPADHLALQNEALARLVERAPWVPVPRLRPTSTGEVMPRVVSADGVERPVRLLTYLPGGVLAEARPHTPELLYDLGAKLGALDQAFVGWTHPAARRTLYWDITRSAEIMAAHGEAVADPERRGLIERVASLWEHTVQPVLPELRRSIVYNDANDHNVLVGDPGPDRGVTGFVDFGDMLESVTVSDPAIAVAYAMLGKSDPLTAATHVVAGYHTAFPLTEAELEVLFPLACARLAVSVCISGRRSQDKVPDAYLSISAASAWEALAHIAEVHPRFARNVLRAACGMEPCPNHAAVVAWLDANGAAVGPVTDPDPAAVPSIDLDLSVGTPLVEDPAVVGTEGLTDIVFGRMREAMVDVAIGHYDEARVWYTGAQYAGPGGEHPERRTIHLGVDVFAESGTPVLAPIDGRVHSVRNNVEHLDYGPTVILEHAPSEGPTFYTLYGHLGEEALALEPGTAVVRGQVFARIGPFAVNGRWPPHLHFQIVTDLLDREGEFPGVGAPIRRATWLSLSPDPNLALRLPRGMRSADRDATVLREARRRQLGPNLSLSYAEPLHIVRGRGTYLYDADGREYLDCVNNVCHVGHAHPRVVRAARDQMTVLNTNTRYLHEHVVRYAERLAATLPDPLSVCFFVNSGSEANELALRLARAHTGANDFVVVEGGYHGNTGGLVEVSHYKFAGPGGSGTPPHVHPVLMPDDYRGPYRRTDPECGVKYAEEVAKAIAAAERNSRRMAGFLVESLLSC
ncbi:MAG: aminotransferase class III-fold pyridoxal phosphate-dependent enzyme, partial [Gemmatimonadales bacterium]